MYHFLKIHMISMEVNKAFAESLEATEGGTPARLAPQDGPAMPGDAPSGPLPRLGTAVH